MSKDTEHSTELRTLEEKIANYNNYVDRLSANMKFIPSKFVSLQMAGAPAGVDSKILLRIDCILSVEPNGDELLTSVVTVSFPVLATKSNYYVIKGSVASIEKRLDIALGRVEITLPTNKSNHELAS